MMNFLKNFNKPPHKNESPEREIIKEKIKNTLYIPTCKEVIDIIKNSTVTDFQGEFCTKGENTIFEIFTREYIEKLGSYLRSRIESIRKETGKMPIILEVGAGNGKLGHALKETLGSSAEVIITDLGEIPLSVNWNIRHLYDVEILDHKKALEKYNPDIVVESWMPYDEDFSKDFRICQNLKEYILIGGNEFCGMEWETWGVDYYDQHIHEKPPFETDGFKKEYLRDFSQYQYGRADYADQRCKGGISQHSTTFSFKRLNN